MPGPSGPHTPPPPPRPMSPARPRFTFVQRVVIAVAAYAMTVGVLLAAAATAKPADPDGFLVWLALVLLMTHAVLSSAMPRKRN